MADNAPNAVQRPPWPNIVCQLNRRIKQHVLSFTGANGTSVMLQTLSSAGCTITYVSEGVYDLTYPAGGTGAVGWIDVCAPVAATAVLGDVRCYAVTANFVTGVARIACSDVAALSDIIGTQTILIHVVEA